MRYAALLLFVPLAGVSAQQPSRPLPEWIRWEAAGINDSGQIVGTRLVIRSDSLRRGETGFVFRPGAPPRYLGTLGGRQSRARGINSAGRVVGASQTRGGAWHAFVYIQGTGMRDLGTLPGDTASEALGINDAGDVVGWSEASSGNHRAFIYSAARGMRSLDTISGHTLSEASAINRAGQVTGFTGTNGNDRRAFLYTPGVGLRDLGTLPGDVSSAGIGINGAGDVVGFSSDGGSRSRAVLYRASDGMRDLSVLMGPGGAGATVAFAINDSGQIGTELPTVFPKSTAVLFTPGTGVQVLGNLDLQRALPTSINGRGQVVGYATFDGGGASQAFLFTAEGGMRNLTVLFAGRKREPSPTSVR